MRITSLHQGSANRLFRLEQRPGFILPSAPAFVNLPHPACGLPTPLLRRAQWRVDDSPGSPGQIYVIQLGSPHSPQAVWGLHGPLFKTVTLCYPFVWRVVFRFSPPVPTSTGYAKKRRFVIEKRRLSAPLHSWGRDLQFGSHGVGIALACVGFGILIILSALYGDAWAVVSSIVYSFSLFTLYLASTLYHACSNRTVKAVLQILDHCSIFLLIAGTYTPFTLITLRGPLGWTLFGVVWAAAIVGIVLNAIDVKKFSKVLHGVLPGHGMGGHFRHQASGA